MITWKPSTLNCVTYLSLTSFSPAAVTVESVNSGESGAVSIYSLNISNLTEFKTAKSNQLIL